MRNRLLEQHELKKEDDYTKYNTLWFHENLKNEEMSH